MELNKTTLGLAAGIAATTIIGYCIYFDKKRRSDPDYKKKVRERRRCARQNAGKPKTNLTNLTDIDELHKLFYNEVQLGENLMIEGKFEEAVEHFALAVMLCGQPEQMMLILQTRLPSNAFKMLIENIQNKYAKQGFSGRSDIGGPTIVSASASPLDFASNTNQMIDTLE